VQGEAEGVVEEGQELGDRRWRAMGRGGLGAHEGWPRGWGVDRHEAPSFSPLSSTPSGLVYDAQDFWHAA
jgi:hypothetical protein